MVVRLDATITKRFVAFARVSSRGQEKDGFSLEVQEEGLHKFAEKLGGTIVRFWKITETASKRRLRDQFREMLAYVRKNHHEINGILVYKLDRATRNMPDYSELVRLEEDYGVRLLSVTEPMLQQNSAGKFSRDVLAAMAAFQTNRLSEDIRDGQARRVQNGWFVSAPPYGYITQRAYRRANRHVEAIANATDSDAIGESPRVIVHPRNGPTVTKIFRMYAWEGHTEESIRETLFKDGTIYTNGQPKFHTSKIGRILNDRSYIGELPYKGEWLPGKHPHLVDRLTWERVQVRLGKKVQRAHQMTYGSRLIRCGHCGHFICGELKTKTTKSGPKDYLYYRCSHLRAEGHPQGRYTEAGFDAQTLELFRQLRIEDAGTRAWFARVIRERIHQDQTAAQTRIEELNKRLTAVRGRIKHALNMRLAQEIDAAEFAALKTEMRDQEARLVLEYESASRTWQEKIDVASDTFELSQNIYDKWLTADYDAKRRILEIVLSDCILKDATLWYQMRKPFDIIVKGLLVEESGGAGNRTPVPKHFSGGIYVCIRSTSGRPKSCDFADHVRPWDARPAGFPAN